MSPNPLVGAVLVRDGEVIGEGFHAVLGERHAEVAAIADARENGGKVAGTTLYVTLEPCAHSGRQPPCTEAILDAEIKRVVIASEDPTEKASGRGPRLLREAEVEVVFADGAEAAAARLLNQPFRKRARHGRPQVIFKAAVSLDGFTATAAGASKWISGSESRALVHRWRAESGAVAIGIATALADDPLLNARDLESPPARQPARVVFDSSARLPLDSRLVESIGGEGTTLPLFVIVAADADAGRVAALRERGAEVIEVEGERPQRIVAALDALGKREIDQVLLEGGAELAGAFLEAGEIDELRIFTAPLVLGSGRPLLAGAGAAAVADAERALSLTCERSGEDLLTRARLREW